MHHGTCVTHVPWCMSGSLTRQWCGKCPRHSRRMRNSRFYVSGKRSMKFCVFLLMNSIDGQMLFKLSLQWRHNGRHNCLLNRLFRRRSKKTSKLRVTDLCAGNSPMTGEFPAQMASNAENVSIWWRHHGWWFERYIPIYRGHAAHHYDAVWW